MESQRVSLLIFSLLFIVTHNDISPWLPSAKTVFKPGVYDDKYHDFHIFSPHCYKNAHQQFHNSAQKSDKSF